MDEWIWLADSGGCEVLIRTFSRSAFDADYRSDWAALDGVEIRDPYSA